MAALARWCYRHRLVVLLLWVGALFGLGVAGSRRRARTTRTVFTLPDTDSTTRVRPDGEGVPGSARATPTRWCGRSTRARCATTAVRSRIEPALEEIAGMKGVGEVASPYAAGGRGADQQGRADRLRPGHLRRAGERACPRSWSRTSSTPRRTPSATGLQVELGGQAIAADPGAADRHRRDGRPRAPRRSCCSWPSARSSRCCCRSVVAVFGVGTGMLSTQLLSHVTDMPEVAPLLGSLIGLGVGIDYALFIVTRHRKGILRGMDPEESAVTALNTSGRAVLFAGGTVCIALAGMLVMNMRFLDGVVIAHLAHRRPERARRDHAAARAARRPRPARAQPQAAAQARRDRPRAGGGERRSPPAGRRACSSGPGRSPCSPSW